MSRRRARAPRCRRLRSTATCLSWRLLRTGSMTRLASTACCRWTTTSLTWTRRTRCPCVCVRLAMCRRRNHLGVVRCHARTADHDARKDLTRVRRVQARWLRQAQRYGALDPRRLHVSSPRRAHTVTATGRSVLHQRTSAQCVVSVTRCVTRAWNASRVASAATSAATAPPRSSAAMIYSEMFCLFTHTSSRRAGATFSATTYATPPKRLAVMEKHARGALATWMSCTWLHVHLQRWRDGSPRHGS